MSDFPKFRLYANNIKDVLNGSAFLIRKNAF